MVWGLKTQNPGGKEKSSFAWLRAWMCKLSEHNPRGRQSQWRKWYTWVQGREGKVPLGGRIPGSSPPSTQYWVLPVLPSSNIILRKNLKSETSTEWETKTHSSPCCSPCLPLPWLPGVLVPPCAGWRGQNGRPQPRPSGHRWLYLARTILKLSRVHI